MKVFSPKLSLEIPTQKALGRKSFAVLLIFSAHAQTSDRSASTHRMILVSRPLILQERTKESYALGGIYYYLNLFLCTLIGVTNGKIETLRDGETSVFLCETETFPHFKL